MIIEGNEKKCPTTEEMTIDQGLEMTVTGVTKFIGVSNGENADGGVSSLGKIEGFNLLNGCLYSDGSANLSGGLFTAGETTLCNGVLSIQNTSNGSGASNFSGTLNVDGYPVLTKNNLSFGSFGYANPWYASAITWATSMAGVTGTSHNVNYYYFCTTILCYWTITGSSYNGMINLSSCTSPVIRLQNQSGFTTETAGTYCNLVYKNSNNDILNTRVAAQYKQENLTFLYNGEHLFQIT